MFVSAVVVAYNRRELLLENLAALTVQTRLLDSIVVVDNASNDGSADAVAEAFPDVDLVRLKNNTGGAGGFAVGIARALTTHEADLVWIMDDDTIPTQTALHELLATRAALSPAPIVLASRVIWTNGADHPMNTPRRKPLASPAERRAAEAVGAIPVRSASFVSSLVDADTIRASGLPIAEYFIWNDDFEFSARLLRHGRGVYCPSSVVVHKTKALADTDVDPGPRFYYEVRNKLWLFRRSNALAPYELPLYLAATARRWLRTVLRSRDRATLTNGFWRGWRAGIRRSPRSNHEFFVSLGVRAPELEEFENARTRASTKR